MVLSKFKIFKQKLGGSRLKKKGCECSGCTNGATCTSISKEKRSTTPATSDSNPKDALVEELLGHLLSTDRQGVLKYLEGLKQDGSR
jgi:hypothetical protein